MTITARLRPIHKYDAKQILRRLPGYCTGRLPDSYGLGRLFRLRFALGILERVEAAFKVKAQGGTDDLGEKWRPLKRETIAQRPVTAGEKRKLGITSEHRNRGLLTDAQDKLWRGIFRSNLMRLISRVGEAEAKRRAAQIAWAILKSMGALTKLEVLGGRHVLIHVVSGDLQRSLSVGRRHSMGTAYVPPPHQVFLVDKRGEMVVGTDLDYAGRVHKLRRLWAPASRQGPWRQYAADRAGEVVANNVERMMR